MVNVLVRMPPELHQQVKSKAVAEDMPMAMWIRRVLRKAVRELPT